MQQSPLLLWRFVLMLIRIRRSKDLLEQFQEFECSSLFAFNYCVYCTTRYNTCGRIGTKWLFFFTFTEECCSVMEKNIGKKLPNRISDQVWYKRCLKGTFGRGVEICEGGSISVSGFGPGGSISASGFGPGVQIRGGSKPAVTPARLLPSVELIWTNFSEVARILTKTEAWLTKILQDATSNHSSNIEGFIN